MENYGAHSNSRRGACTKFEHRKFPNGLRQTSWPGRVTKQQQQQQHHVSGPRILRQRRANSYSSDPLNLRWVAQESIRREMAGESPMPGDSALNSPVLADASSGVSAAEAKTAAVAAAATVEAVAAEVTASGPSAPTASWRRRRSSAEASAVVGAAGAGGQFNRQRSLSFKRPPPHRFVPVYGNYRASRRGGLNMDRMQDDRLQLLQPDWYTDKEVLDIGCNDGVFSLKIAETLRVRSLTGVDIDTQLVSSAQANLRRKRAEADEEARLRRQLASEGFQSADSTAAAPSTLTAAQSVGSNVGKFPHNVAFVTGNYVLENEAQLASVEENKYDIIQAFSITKWIHLNWGDPGLKLFFRRAFRELRPDGKFIVEPQPYQTYRRHLLCPAHCRNYASNIDLRPEQFRSYLEHEVGFAHILAISEQQQCHGFQRPLLMCSKPTGCTPAPPLSLGPLVNFQQQQQQQLQYRQLPRAESAEQLFMDRMAAVSSTTLDTPQSIRLPEEVISPLWEVDYEAEDNNNNNVDGVVLAAELPVQVG